MNKEQYQKYLKSDHWKQFRRSLFVQSDKTKCERCNHTKGLQIHHLHYNSLWHEIRTDVLILCRGCHRELHGMNRWEDKKNKRYKPAKSMKWSKKKKTSYGEYWNKRYQKYLELQKQDLPKPALTIKPKTSILSAELSHRRSPEN